LPLRQLRGQIDVMAALKDLRAALLSRLDEALRPLGFRKRQQSFHLESGPCRRSFHVAFVNHASDFDVTADMAVRHHAVEDLLNAERLHLSGRQKNDTATVGAELGNIAGVGQHRWQVAEAGDVEHVAEDILDWFRRVGEPFLQRYSDLDAVSQVLAADGAEARLICPIPQLRAKTAAAIQSLLNSR
jgi:hypothetical protein